MTQLVKIALKRKSNQYGILTLTSIFPSIQTEWSDAVDGLVAIIDQPVRGTSQVFRFILRSFPDNIYPLPANVRSNIDYWIDFGSVRLNSSDFKKLQSAFGELNNHLKLRSYLVGYQISAADYAIWGALKANNIWVKIHKTPKDYIYLARWYDHVSANPHCIKAVELVMKSNEVSKDKKDNKDQGKFDIDLNGAKRGQVVTRFPPEPSGYLHIGHAKAVLLNEYFARAYDGTLLIRFDDTNPSKEKVEFEESIMEDIKMLGVKGDKLSWTSDHFDLLLEMAEKLIRKGLAYVDDTTKEVMRAERMDGIASKNRDISVEENLKRFEEMKRGTEWGLSACLRAKISVDAKNKALRDPVIYRCNLLPHNRTKDRYKVYPTYDFCCPIVDSIEGVTHALRTNEYHDRNDQVNFVHTLMSKRKLQWFVDQGKVSGWDDPRFPTVRGILRRGMQVETLKQFTLSQGASKNTILMEWDKIWTLNKQFIDPISPRFTGLKKQNIVSLKLSNGPSTPEKLEIAKHKKNPNLGTKPLIRSNVIYLDQEDAKEIADQEEVTLMDWGNMIVEKIHKNNENVVVSLEGRLHLEGDFKKTKKKLTWLSVSEDLSPFIMIDYDYLITKKKLEEEDSFEDCLNPITEFKTEMLGDLNVKHLKTGEVIQLERRGYFRVDKQFDPVSKTPAELILIPDGKAASTNLKYAPK